MHLNGYLCGRQNYLRALNKSEIIRFYLFSLETENFCSLLTHPLAWKRKLAQKGNRKLLEKTFLLLSSCTNINKINFTCFPGVARTFPEAENSCSSYYFDYVYSSHEIQMPVSCALHLINPCHQVKARNDFHGIFVCSCASFPHFVWLAKWKNKRLGNYFQLHLPMDNALVWQTSYLITYSFSSLMRWDWIYLLAHVEHTHLYFDHLWFAWDLKGTKGKTKLFNMATNLDTVCDLSTIWQIWPSSNAIFAILPSLILMDHVYISVGAICICGDS